MDDTDMAVSLRGYGAWTDMQEKLATLGFDPDIEEVVITLSYRSPFAFRIRRLVLAER